MFNDAWTCASLASLFLISSLNVYGEVLLSSPEITLNSKDQRVVEFKIQNASIKDNDISLYEYKTINPINDNGIAYTLLEDFGNYQSFKVILSEKYKEDYFSLTIKIKNEFIKDIFIFLPSKLRNSYSKPIEIENRKMHKKLDQESNETKENQEEISQIADANDKQDFLESMGLQETGLKRVIKKGYEILNYINYFTAGEKELRAWTITKGTLAPSAAGTIHSDMEKGFIRAETISFDDYLSHKGETGAKEKGKLRLEGKEYEVKDGDIMHFLFNV